jgi:hypothetical protein
MRKVQPAFTRQRLRFVTHAEWPETGGNLGQHEAQMGKSARL